MTLATLIAALIIVESGGKDDAVGDGGMAVGCLQIWPCALDDVNRIAGTDFTLADRFDRQKSIRMCEIYLKHWGAYYERQTGKRPTAKVLARIWNGGPAGWKHGETLAYWRKVWKTLDEQRVESEQAGAVAGRTED